MLSEKAKIHSRLPRQLERATLCLIAEGYNDREIADELCISEKAVGRICTELMKKLSARDGSSLVQSALEKGVISVYEILESRFSKSDPEAT